MAAIKSNKVKAKTNTKASKCDPIEIKCTKKEIAEMLELKAVRLWRGGYITTAHGTKMIERELSRLVKPRRQPAKRKARAKTKA